MSGSREDGGTVARQLEIRPTRAKALAAAAGLVVSAAAEAARARGRFSIALAGGETPRGLYQLLASAPFATRVDWSRVQVFWGDERCVPPTDAESNFRMAREALLDHVPVLPEDVHRIRGEDEPAAAAAAYERLLRETFAGGSSIVGPSTAGPSTAGPSTAGPSTAGSAAAGPEQTFDLTLLGLGPEGHTASLFPGGVAVSQSARWVVAEKIPQLGRWRVTLAPVVLNASATVMFLVLGSEKAEIVQRVFHEPRNPELLPAQAIAPRTGRLVWVLDAAAGEGIRG